MEIGVDYTHVIMTRFNVARPKRQNPIRLQPEWLAERFDLFERYCLPSIAAQTSKDFQWVVYFDVDTPREFRPRIEACQEVVRFTAYFTPVIDAAGWTRSLREVVAADTPWLVSTRFDNDDALAVDYAARLHAALARESAPRRGSFNFTHGFVVEGGKLYALEHPSNPFASWLEPWDDDMQTAMGGIRNHTKLAEYGPVVQIGGPAAWLQVVHGGNVSNKVRGRRVDVATAHGRFPSEAQACLQDTSRLEIALENLFLTPIRQGRDAIIGLWRRNGGRVGRRV